MSAKLPTTAAGWIQLIVFVAMAILTAIQASDSPPSWVPYVIAGLGALSAALKPGIIPGGEAKK